MECAVCYAELTDASTASLPCCPHVFCAPCLSRWLATAHTCPLCKAPASSYLLRGEEHACKQEVRAGGPENDAPDLSCLDERFFIDEVARLTERADEANRRAAARGDRQALEALAPARAEIAECLCGLEEGAKARTCAAIDAQALLLRLYELQDVVEAARRGIPMALSPAGLAAASPRRYTADEADDAADDDDDDTEAERGKRHRAGRKAKARAGRRASVSHSESPQQEEEEQQRGRHRQQDPVPFAVVAAVRTGATPNIPFSGARNRQRH